MADLDIDYSDLELKYSSHYESPLSSTVILDGAPVVGPDRAEKLISAIIKASSKEAGVRLSKDAIEMPVEEEGGRSKGFLFVTLANETEKHQFAKAMHGYAFDKKHTFSVVPFDEVDKFEALDEDWKEPAQEEWVPKVRLFFFVCGWGVFSPWLLSILHHRRSTSAIG